MKQSFRKMILSMISMVLTISMICPMASAIIPGEDIFNSGNITREELFISEAVAYEIAKLFIADAMSIEGVSWDGETEIVDTVIMYDETIYKNVTAYSFELNNGYVVVSAYLDVPNIILEWSDEADPVYAAFDMSETDDIIYTGALNYFKDSGGTTLETVYGNSVSRDDIYNVLTEVSDISNVPEGVLRSISTSNTSSTLDTPGNTISDPYTHANLNYAGPFFAQDWINHWEDYALHLNDSDFPNIVSHCGPIALTNILCMFGGREGSSILTEANSLLVFNDVVDIGEEYSYFVEGEGTGHNSVRPYIQRCLWDFGFSNSSVSAPVSPITFANLQTALSNESILWLGLSYHSIYGNHAVVCYAYTRLISQSTNAAVIYLKISDGYESAPRYVEFSTLSRCHFWEVNCN